MEKQNYIITGGGGSGKTTLINALAAKGLATCPEVSRQIIKQQQTLGGDKMPWLNLLGFGKLCYRAMVQQLNTVRIEPCFFDRGIPDIHAYFACNELAVDKQFFDRLSDYAPLVFICPPWEEIFVNDAQRPESFAYSVNIFNCLKQIYKHLGFQLIIVPKATVAERVFFIEECISKVLVSA